MLHQPDEDVLENILGVAAVSGDAIGHLKNTIVVSFESPFEFETCRGH